MSRIEEKTKIMNKQSIRKEVFARRKQVTKDFLEFNSEIIAEKVIEDKEYQKASSIFVYSDIRGEVATKSITNHAFSTGKKVCFPKILEMEAGKMSFYQVDDTGELEEGIMGILEPKTTKCFDEYTEDAVIIVPIVGFDKQCYRVGYGGGFYDRYLRKYKFKSVIGIAFDFQCLEIDKIDEYDYKLEKILTETSIYG